MWSKLTQDNKIAIFAVVLTAALGGAGYLVKLAIDEPPAEPGPAISVETGGDSAEVSNSGTVQIAQGGSQIHNSFPQPNRVKAVYVPEKGFLSINKTPGSFVANPKVKVYRTLDLQLFGNCECVGSANAVSVHLSSVTVNVRNESELLASVGLESFVNESIETAEKWSVFLKRFGLCGAATITVPVEVSYDDQFATNRSAYYVLHRGVSPIGIHHEWRVDSSSDDDMRTYASRYFASRERRVSRTSTEQDLFRTYIRGIKAKFGNASLKEATEAFKNKETFVLERVSWLNYAQILALADAIERDAAELEKADDCQFDTDFGSRFQIMEDFGPVEIIDPPKQAN